MRMLLKVNVPAKAGNVAAKSGELQRSIQATMAKLKPEAAYFFPENGNRSMLMVFDMQGSWQLPATVESLFEAFDASITLTPVMNAEDLARGFKEAGM
jgi:hypothetical protein